VAGNKTKQITYPLVIDDLDNSSELASGWAVIKEDKTADFDEPKFHIRIHIHRAEVK
jgi:hypothetical protein